MMASFGFVFKCAFVLYGLVPRSEGLTCYQCTSVELPDQCGSEFRLQTNTTHYVDNCQYCLKTVTGSGDIVRNCKVKEHGVFSIKSGCSTEKMSGSDVTTCACGSAFCNGTPRQFSSIQWLYVLLSISITSRL